MPSSKPVLLPSNTVCAELEVKKSRFIAHLGRAESREQAVAFINARKRTYSDASHNCWAYLAGLPDQTPEVGTSDDGEPKGTAGKPMLSIFQHKNIGQVVVVVSRYYGGIKLGTGGLVRAYTEVLQKALQSMIFEEFVAKKTYLLTIPFACENAVRNVLKSSGLQCLNVNYDNGVEITLSVPDDNADLWESLQGATSGAISFKEI